MAMFPATCAGDLQDLMEEIRQNSDSIRSWSDIMKAAKIQLMVSSYHSLIKHRLPIFFIIL